MLFIYKNRRLHQYVMIIMICMFIYALGYVLFYDMSLDKFMYQIIFSHSDTLNSYLICTMIYILVLILCSSSYMGIPFITLSITYRMILLIYSLKMINYTSINFMTFFMIVIQIIIELMMTYCISYVCIYLSKHTFMLTFMHAGNYNLKQLVNFILNYLLIIMALILIGSLIKVYLLP